MILLFPLLTILPAMPSTRAPSYYLSFEATKRTRLYFTPYPNAKVRGAIQRGTRLAVVASLPKRRCRGGYFVRFGKECFGCSSNFRPSLKFPGVAPPRRSSKKYLSGHRYFKVLRPNTPVFDSKAAILAGRPARFLPTNAWIAYQRNFRRAKGELFMRDQRGRLVPFFALDERTPSRFAGFTYAPTPPGSIPAVVNSLGGAQLWAVPLRRSRGHVQQWTPLMVYPERIRVVKKKRFFRTPGGRYIYEGNIRRVFFSSPPSYLRHPKERWIEVNLRQQTLVAYEGEQPVFYTLISTAREGYNTPKGVFRIFYKRMELTLSSRRGKRYRYLFERVPYVQFFKGVLALHTAYWHDLFGTPWSRGCIELSPKDAAFLFHWTSPSLPKGYFSLAQTREERGTLLRIVDYPGEGVNYRAKSTTLR